MALEPPLSLVELAGIERHTVPLIEACTDHIAGLRAIRTKDNAQAIDPHLTYWRNARSALRWSLGIARQRKRKGK